MATSWPNNFLRNLIFAFIFLQCHVHQLICVGVKRRSVRGTSSRQSRRSDRGAGGGGTTDRAGSSGTHRSSTRSSRRKVHHVNPVTKLMEQQNSFPSFKHSTHSNLTENNLKTLNNDYILNNQYHHQIPKKEMMPSKSTPALNSFAQKQSNKAELTSAAMNRHTPTDPIYYNMNSSSPLIVQQTTWNDTSTPSPQAYATNHFHHHHQTRNDAAASLGHTNLTYVHSNPSLVDDGEMNEYYQAHRPPSVHSSYSNFHGARPLSYNPNPGGPRENTKENLFAGLTQSQAHQHRPQTLYQSTQPQAIPQVPQKKAGSRDRFLNNAPPAYHPYNQFNHHTPPDSETTM